MTHDDLVLRALTWLKAPRKTKGFYKPACGVVVPELVSYHTEIPDAMGWVHNVSYMVECKCSRSDFLKDQKKRSHRVGAFRFYLCEPGIILPADVPEGWGLLYAKPRRITIEVLPSYREPNVRGELLMMYSLLRRAEVRGTLRGCFSPKWSGHGYANLAEDGVLEGGSGEPPVHRPEQPRLGDSGGDRGDGEGVSG